MGIETSSPDVEESTEPPLCSSIQGGLKKRPLSSPVEDSAAPDRRLDEGEKAAVYPDKPEETTTSVVLSLDEGDWNTHYQFAHTYPISDISRVLEVDIQ